MANAATVPRRGRALQRPHASLKPRLDLLWTRGHHGNAICRNFRRSAGLHGAVAMARPPPLALWISRHAGALRTRQGIRWRAAGRANPHGLLRDDARLAMADPRAASGRGHILRGDRAAMDGRYVVPARPAVLRRFHYQTTYPPRHLARIGAS